MRQTGPSLSNGYSWLYASRCNLSPHVAAQAIDDIVLVSRVRNEALGVTGALLFNDQRFVQYLEGPEPALTGLRISIERDQRHGGIVTIAAGCRSHRRFQQWLLAYSGPSLFIASRIEAALTEQAQGEEPLVQLLQEFAGSQAD